MLATANGWTAEVIATGAGKIWSPLAATAFADSCRTETIAEMLVRARDPACKPRVIVGVKPVPETVRAFEALTRGEGLPGFLDVDDPDIEGSTSWEFPIRRAAKELVRPAAMREWRSIMRVAKRRTGIVSNPVLAARYGGTVVPHVRQGVTAGAPHTSRTPVIAFVGTNRAHKGVGILREALEGLQPLGFSLVITDEPPDDAHPWERWTGFTSLTDGIRLVQSSDIVVTPSLRSASSTGQLPVKVIDAMLASRALVVSDVEPLPWAIGNAGLVTKAGSVPELKAALTRLIDPNLRHLLGEAARAVALSRYTVEVQTPIFARVVERFMFAPNSTQEQR